MPPARPLARPRSMGMLVVLRFSRIEPMNDTVRQPDHERLFQTASAQAGYFTTPQAQEAGFAKPLLTHHTATGRFIRVARGLYRFRDYPTSPREEVIASWLQLGPDSVVSHESALDLFGLSDVIPDAVHLTVPRARRRLSKPSGVVVHTTTRPPNPAEVLTRDGVRVTAPSRAIVDAAEAGLAPEQVVRAVREALERGLTTPARLRRSGAGRARRVEELIERALTEAPA